MDELKALADQCICHPASRGIADIEAAGECLKDLIAKLENAEAAVKQARIDALEEAKTLIENYPFWLGTTAKAEICTAIESLKGTP